MPRPTSDNIQKNVLVLTHNDVTRRDGGVFTSTHMNLSKLRKPGSSQFKTKVKFTTGMTDDDIKNTLEGIFPMLKGKRYDYWCSGYIYLYLRIRKWDLGKN